MHEQREKRMEVEDGTENDRGVMRKSEGHLQNLEEETREPSREVSTVTRSTGLVVFKHRWVKINVFSYY